MKHSMVTVLTGVVGSGKTTFLKQFFNINLGTLLQVLTPTQPHQPLDILSADWDNHAFIAIDEVLMWDRATAPTAIAALEKEAVARGKKLILITQLRDDLAGAGIHLTSNPVYLDLSR